MNLPRQTISRCIVFVLVVLGFSLGAHADIPFSLSYSTYLGGSSWEHARDIFTDAAGFTYVVGGTGSSNFAGASSFPGTNIYNAGQPNSAADGAFGGCDVFITKMSPSGQVLWTKYMGGANYDRAYALELDSAGNIYISGRAGRGFPMVNAIQSTFSGTSSPSSYGDQNAFVAKLNSAGDVLWSTYLGTGELARDIAIDAAGDVYVPLVLAITSSRTAFNTPALSAFQGKFFNSPPTTNTNDVGLVKLRGDGSGVIWARWIGGTGSEVTNPSIRVNSLGEAHLLFSTTSTNASLPSVGVGVQTNNGGGEDSYVAKVAADGASLIYGTYLGGTGAEAHETHSLALDAAGNAVVGIHTSSTNFPISPGAVNSPARGGIDIAVVKLDGNGVRVSSAVVGGSGSETPDGIYVDASGRVFLSFETSSTNFPVTPGAFDLTANGSNDGGFLVLSADLTRLEYATLFGGALYDNARAMFLSSDGSVYLTGGTLSTNLPTLNAYDTTFNGGSHPFAPGSGDAWVVRFVDDTRAGINMRKIEAQPGGGMHVTFARAPGLGYRVQSRDDLVLGSWQDRATVLPDAPGEFEFIDPPPLPARRFYRAIAP
jgi:hypothetical protein